MKCKGIEIENPAVPFTGTITDVNDTEITVRISARVGILKLARRAYLSNSVPKAGDKVSFRMSLIEVEDDQ